MQWMILRWNSGPLNCLVVCLVGDCSMLLNHQHFSPPSFGGMFFILSNHQTSKSEGFQAPLSLPEANSSSHLTFGWLEDGPASLLGVQAAYFQRRLLFVSGSVFWEIIEINVSLLHGHRTIHLTFTPKFVWRRTFLGCPKLGSMVSEWVITPAYPMYK